MSSDSREAGHDYGVPNPVRNSYFIEEKPPISSESSSRFRKNVAMSQDNRLPSAKFSESKLPLRKYSRAWWKSYWNNAIKRGQVPRMVYGGFGLVIVSAWILFTVLTAKNEISWNKSQFANSIDRMRELMLRYEWAVDAWVFLEGSLKNFDPTSRTLTVEWSGLQMDLFDEIADPVPFVNTSGVAYIYPLEIYRDIATCLWIEDPPYIPQTSGALHYRIGNLSTAPIAALGWTPDDSFDTEISFKQAQDTSAITKIPLFAYPFDEWKGSITFLANSPKPYSDALPNNTKHQVLPLLGARLTDHALNWRFKLEQDVNCPDPEDSFQMVLNSTMIDFSGPSNVTNQDLGSFTTPCHLRLDLFAMRPPIVKFAAVISVIVNWTSTFFIFILTCEVLVMRRGFMMSGTDLLGVAFTSLFALPSIRMLLPGAPDFGALNLIGIIPNVIIISACVCAIAIGKLNRKKKANSVDAE
ncbi:hypothetical protein CPB86DRAFT_813834 [Serendipita vermifera]|nr:hypothetical protein CPB86DRAFT_813834 [Serendipita vermifera]